MEITDGSNVHEIFLQLLMFVKNCATVHTEVILIGKTRKYSAYAIFGMIDVGDGIQAGRGGPRSTLHL
jgi:hypothetical protein